MRAVPLRRLLSAVDNGSWGAEPGEGDIDVQCVRAADFDFDGLNVDLSRAPVRSLDAKSWERLRLRPGDIVLEKSGGGEMAPVGRAVLFHADRPAVTSNFAARVRPATNVDSRFLVYVLRSLYDAGITLKCIKQTTGIQNLDTEHWLQSCVAYPSPSQQKRIADFLDDRVARIDRIIAARREQIQRSRTMVPGLLQRALDECKGRKSRLRYVCSPIDERDVVDDLPLLSVSIHRGVVPRDASSSRQSASDDLTNYKCVQPGDLVLNRMRAFQGAVGVSRYHGLVSPDYLVLRVSDNVDPEWLDIMFRSPWFVGQMTARLRGIGNADLGTVRTPRVNWSDLADIEIDVPDLLRQRVAEEAVHITEAWLVEGQVSLSRSIDLLAEYKTFLITAAVTGELDVTTAGSGIPA